MFWSFTLTDAVEVEPVYFPSNSISTRSTASLPAELQHVKPIAAPSVSPWADLILHRLTERYVGKVVERLGLCIAVEHVLEYTPCEVRGPTASVWLTAVFDVCVFAPPPGTRLRARIAQQSERGMELRIDFFAGFPIIVPSNELVEGSLFDDVERRWYLPLDEQDAGACNPYHLFEEVVARVTQCLVPVHRAEKEEVAMQVLASFRGDCLGPVAWFDDGEEM